MFKGGYLKFYPERVKVSEQLMEIPIE